jgi:hypothetical protein
MNQFDRYRKAKEIPICGFLARINIYPKWKDEAKNLVWYCSPFRNETEPSFKVNLKKNVWIDFGLKETFGAKNKKGGDLLDLVKLLNPGITDQAALSIILNLEFDLTSFSFRGNSQNKNESNTIEIKHLQPFQNRALVNYLASRKISQGRAFNYVNECYYQVNGKKYFALCWENIKNGYALHNAYRKKYTAGNAAATIIKGNNKNLNFFESMIDFLSALEYYQMNKSAGTTIVLNSTTNLIEPILKMIKDYPQINLFLDNDDTGQQAAENIKKAHPKVKDFSKIIYPDHNDFNDFLTGNIAK